MGIALDVPGYNAENLTIKLESHFLTVSGERKNRIGDTFVIRHCFDVEESMFDEETIKASLADGVLEITVQKKNPKSKTKVIPISTGNTSLLAEDVSDEDNDKDAAAVDEDEKIVVEN